jgi:hypothetical protein
MTFITYYSVFYKCYYMLIVLYFNLFKRLKSNKITISITVLNQNSFLKSKSVIFFKPSDILLFLKTLLRVFNDNKNKMLLFFIREMNARKDFLFFSLHIFFMCTNIISLYSFFFYFNCHIFLYALCTINHKNHIYIILTT